MVLMAAVIEGKHTHTFHRTLMEPLTRTEFSSDSHTSRKTYNHTSRKTEFLGRLLNTVKTVWKLANKIKKTPNSQVSSK